MRCVGIPAACAQQIPSKRGSEHRLLLLLLPLDSDDDDDDYDECSYQRQVQFAEAGLAVHEHGIWPRGIEGESHDLATLGLPGLGELVRVLARPARQVLLLDVIREDSAKATVPLRSPQRQRRMQTASLCEV